MQEFLKAALSHTGVTAMGPSISTKVVYTYASYVSSKQMQHAARQISMYPDIQKIYAYILEASSTIGSCK